MGFSILQSEFITSAPSIKEAPEWVLPEIAMVGRSNVGKSSLINALANRKNLAKTSNTPGKTRLLNFYQMNQQFSLVDLPGYGYAKVSKTMQWQWQKNFQVFLQKRKNLILVVQLVDARLDLQDSDKAMLDWLKHHQIPVIVVMTKVDKLSRTAMNTHAQKLAQQLGLTLDQLFCFSAQSGWGKEPLLEFLGAYLEAVTIEAKE